LDGASPGDLILDSAGNLFGATELGGVKGVGAVFKIDTDGNLSEIYSFEHAAIPEGGLIRDTTGNFYCTTNQGGSHDLGTVFKIDLSGKGRELYSFTGGLDGGSPEVGLTLDGAGNLYGVSIGGMYGAGVLFKIAP
jgi:uncharacterized repeat protein (TIGR03803 family)